jgi:N-acetylglucosamine-6-sulfatase
MYQYFNTTLQHNDEPPVSYPGIYATDLLANKSLDWLDFAATQDAPFFLAINPVNPHGHFNWTTKRFSDPVPAPRHANLFEGALLPRTENFNPANVRFQS